MLLQVNFFLNIRLYKTIVKSHTWPVNNFFLTNVTVHLYPNDYICSRFDYVAL